MKKKILLAVLVIAILLGIGGAYAYFATDTLKSEKEIFFSYMTTDIFSNIKDEKIAEYLKKQLDTPYTNKGDVSVKVGKDDEVIIGANEIAKTEDDETMQMLNDSKITFEGKIDNSKKAGEQTLTVNLSQGINVPVKIRYNGESFGVQSNLLNTKFIAIRNENLKSLFERFGADAEEIPDKIEFDKSKFTEEEIKTLKNRYMSILNDNLGDKLFRKEKKDDQTVINLMVSDVRCIEILTKILETLHDDDIILNKLSGIMDEEEYKQKINEAIDEIKDIDTDGNTALEINLYVKSKKVKKLEIKAIDNDDSENTITAIIENDENKTSISAYEGLDRYKTIADLSIEKVENENDTTYVINSNVQTDDEEKVTIGLKMQFKNIKALDNVEENYEVKFITEDDTIKLYYNNLKTFNKDVEVESFNSDNAIILNDATDEEINNLLVTLYDNLGLY